MNIVIPHNQIILPNENKTEANKEVSIAFDVDGTLISLNNDSPRYDVIALFNAFKLLGCRMIIWSGSGIDYASRWAYKLGLKAEILEKGSMTPDIIFDDAEALCGRITIRV